MPTQTATDQAITKLSDNIEQAIKALQKVAPHAWETMVRQVILVNALSVGAWALTVIAAWWLTKQTIHLAGMKDNGEYRSDKLDRFTAICGIAAACAVIAAFIMAVAGGPDTVSALLNPEYTAAVQLLWAVK